MSNKWFGTDGVRGVANNFPMNADFAFKLASACAQKVCLTHKKAAIGRDTRCSSDMLEAALSAGFMSQGVDVVSLGVLPTPAVTSLTSDLGVDMSVMITASHNPYHDNGIKLITATGDKFSDAEIATIEALIEAGDFSTDPEKIGRRFEDESAAEKYKNQALNMAGGGKPLQGLKVVLDCANGCFCRILPEVFQTLGASIVVLADQPDGKNVNLDCGSMHPQNMMAQVVAGGADFGLAVDGDGDRIIVCDDRGQKISSEQIIGFLADFLNRKGLLKGRAVVSTVLSNTGLETFIKKMGVPYYSTPVGERHVVAKMQEIGGALGGEESGHLVAGDYCRTGDGLMIGLLLAQGLKESGRKMSEIFPLFAMEPMVFVNPRLKERADVKRITAGAELQSLLEKCRQEMGEDGRVVIHPSGTEPLIRVWVCGKEADKVEAIGKRLVDYIASDPACAGPAPEIKLLFTSRA